MPRPDYEEEGWWATYGQIVDELRERAQFPKVAPPPRDAWDDMAATAGLRVADRETVEVSIPLDGGPEQHWDWLTIHVHRGLYGALEQPAREEFRERVLESLRTEHPTGGTQLSRSADFYRMTR